MTHTVNVAVASDGRVSESERIARILAGDELAARELYDECAPRVYRLAYRITGDAEMARECTQDTFVRAYARLARFRGESAFSTWLHRITVTVAADAMRRRKRLRDRETQLDDRLSIPCGDGDGVDPILRGRLHRAIDALPEIYRLTVILHDIEGYTHVEIAEMLGVAEGTCKSRLSLARARLRAALGGVAKELE